MGVVASLSPDNSMMHGSFYSNFFLILLLVFFLRLLYARHMMRVRASLASRSPTNSPHLAPYFIRLRAAQDARLYQQAVQEQRLANDLPPKYEDIIISQAEEGKCGCTNLAMVDDTGLPAYNEIHPQLLLAEEHLHPRPGRH